MLSCQKPKCVALALIWALVASSGSAQSPTTEPKAPEALAKPPTKRTTIAPQIVAAMNAMNAAAKAGDADAMATLWDLESLLIRADQRLDLPPAFTRRLKAIAKNMKPNLIKGMVGPGSGLSFERCSYHRVGTSKDGKRTAITVRLWRVGGHDSWMKFWLTRADTKSPWVFYDYFAIDVGIYLSDLVGSALKGAATGNREKKKTFIEFSRLLTQFASARNRSLLEPILALNSSHLPDSLRGMKSFMLVCLYCQEEGGRPIARKIAEDGISAGYELPALHLSHAFNLCALKDYDTALLAIEEWGKQVAKDDAYYEVRGDALFGKGKKREAFQEYVKAFRDNPANQDVVLRAMDILPPAQKGTVAQFIAAATDPRGLSAALVNELEQAGHKKALGAVIAALEKRAPKDPALPSYRKRLAAMP